MENRNIRQRIIYIISYIALPIVKFYWFLFRPKIYGIRCIIEHNGEILLVRHTYGKGLWTFPGGGIAKNENPKDTAIREIKEELGIIANNFIKVGQVFDASEYVKDFITCFKIKISEKALSINKDEILEAKWYHQQNLPPLSDVTQKILNLWKNNQLND